MAKGRQGFYLEAWKFAVYLAVPVGAAAYFGDPANQRRHAEYWSYVRYPADPSVGLAEQVKELHKQRAQREEYRRQLQDLDRRARLSSDDAAAAAAAEAGTADAEAEAASGSGGGGGTTAPHGWWNPRRWI
jgi:hypothetical protein